MHKTALAVQEIIAQRYIVERPIAQGGMGAVYLGRQLGLDRRVAIKTLIPQLASNPEALALFRREAMAVRQLSHPNTIRIYDFGETRSGQLYLVMEFLEGQCLDEVLRERGALPVATVVDIGRQVLKSLIEAHACGVVHRDIKPSNLMHCHQLGETNFVKVLDFGVAISLSDALGYPKESTGELSEQDVEDTAVDMRAARIALRLSHMVGTPMYMSPEQVLGRPVDGRSDLYSLGMTLFELAVGRPPYGGCSAAEAAQLHLRPGPPEIPAILDASVLGDVIRKAVSKQPEHRYQTATDMLNALEAESRMRGADLSLPPLRRPEPTGPNFEVVSTGQMAITVVDRPSRRLVAVTEARDEPAGRVDDATEITSSPALQAKTPQPEATVDDERAREQIRMLIEYRLKDRWRRRVAQNVMTVLLLVIGLIALL